MLKEIPLNPDNDGSIKNHEFESDPMLGIDALGLEATDRRILTTLERLGGGPVGLRTIAVSVGEEDDTIELVYEPHLIRLGLLAKTPRGRMLTDTAREHMGLMRASGQTDLFAG